MINLEAVSVASEGVGCSVSLLFLMLVTISSNFFVFVDAATK
jgi:hypothetical protein